MFWNREQFTFSVQATFDSKAKLPHLRAGELALPKACCKCQCFVAASRTSFVRTWPSLFRSRTRRAQCVPSCRGNRHAFSLFRTNDVMLHERHASAAGAERNPIRNTCRLPCENILLFLLEFTHRRQRAGASVYFVLFALCGSSNALQLKCFKTPAPFVCKRRRHTRCCFGRSFASGENFDFSLRRWWLKPGYAWNNNRTSEIIACLELVVNTWRETCKARRYKSLRITAPSVEGSRLKRAENFL